MIERPQTGPLPALMDELERATKELMGIIRGITDEEFAAVRDAETPDPDCRSIHTVIRHVVRSGHGYADYFRGAFGTEPNRPELRLDTRDDCLRGMESMLGYMAATLEGHWEMTPEEEETIEINTRWGQTFDFDQLFEHAVVHVLRHRRQIERFLTAGT